MSSSRTISPWSLLLLPVFTSLLGINVSLYLTELDQKSIQDHSDLEPIHQFLRCLDMSRTVKDAFTRDLMCSILSASMLQYEAS